MQAKYVRVRACVFACIIEHVDCVSNLLTHAVDTVRPQQVDRLLHQVCATTAEHTEAQVLQELRFSRGGVQFPWGTEAVIRSEKQNKAKVVHNARVLFSSHVSLEYLTGLILIWHFLHVQNKEARGLHRRTAVPQLTGLAVHSGKQQSGSLPNIVAVNGEAASVFCVSHGHAHPLHQRWQHHERPAGRDRGTRFWPRETGLHVTLGTLNVQSKPSRKIHLRQNLHVISEAAAATEDVWERGELCLADKIKRRSVKVTGRQFDVRKCKTGPRSSWITDHLSKILILIFMQCVSMNRYTHCSILKT